jgi:2-polyprenyl-6-methoxyphenol hydroxylase-like FAD-dependent oxidoreductase
VLADVRLDWDLPTAEVQLFFSPAGLVVVAPLPGGHHRVVATVDSSVGQAPEHPGLDDITELLSTRGPSSPTRVHEVVWSSRFRVHHRLAGSYRRGPVFLAGDAAHVHSPAGGQGMNTGIQDAALLGSLLADVLSADADLAVLDSYETRRRPVARDVVRMTDRMTRAATLRGSAARLRNLALRVVTGRPTGTAEDRDESGGAVHHLHPTSPTGQPLTGRPPTHATGGAPHCSLWTPRSGQA